MHGVDDPDVEIAVATFVKLMRAARAVATRLEPLMAAHGLTMTQFGVLEAILHRGPLTHRELGRKVLTSAANMTDVIDKLELRGLVRRVRCPEDRRLVHVDLTDAGRCLIARLFPVHAEDIARAMAGLGHDQLAELGALLRALGMAAAEPPLAGPCPVTHLDA
jgi:MarR family 2-MHQ and catechol resistance regulon transcriptional repressor